VAQGFVNLKRESARYSPSGGLFRVFVLQASGPAREVAQGFVNLKELFTSGADKLRVHPG